MLIVFQALIIGLNKTTIVHSKYLFKIFFIINLYTNLLLQIGFIALNIHEINKKEVNSSDFENSHTLKLFFKYLFLYLKIALFYFWMAKYTIKGF